MALGGYKLVKFSWSGGRSDTPVDRLKFVLSGVTGAITGANLGWVYDTLTPTSSDFIQMPSPSGDTTNNPNFIQILTLTYGGHTYKLGIGIVYKTDSSRTPFMKPSDCSATAHTSYNNSQNGHLSGGLYFGMVKDGNFITDSTYNLVWDGNGCFVRWTSFCNSGWVNSSSTSTSQSMIWSNSSSATYFYYVLIKNAQLCFFIKSSTYTSGPRIRPMLVGEIFKETVHLSDTNTMGILSLADNWAPESYNLESSETFLIYSNIGSTTQISYSTSSGISVSSQIFNRSGDLLFGDYRPNGTFLYYVKCWFDTRVVGNTVSNTITTPGGRWTPVYMYVDSSDQDTYGVVPGDGVKGFVDTDFLIGVNPNYSYGQLLGPNGSYVYLGGGFAIGWDSTNTETLF